MSFLFPAQKQNKPALDTSLVEPSVRGTLLPLSMGLNRVSPVIGYVGNTLVLYSHAHADEPKQYYYLDSGLHFLSIGQGKALTRIIKDGKTVFDSYITPTTHPAGTTITIPATYFSDSFRVYWGDATQPVDTVLAGLTGIASSYPYIMYIVWDRISLGTSKKWPTIEYEIFVAPQQTTLFGNDPIYNRNLNAPSESVVCDISEVTFVVRDTYKFYDGRVTTYYRVESVITTTDPNIINVQAGWVLEGTVNSVWWRTIVTGITEDAGVYTITTQDTIPTAWEGFNDQTLSFEQSSVTLVSSPLGINPIAVLYQLLFETYPHGLGQPTSLYNLTDMETLFDYFATMATHTPISIYLNQGKSIKDGINMVLQDCGISMAWDCTTGQYRFRKPLSTDTINVIPEGLYSLSDGYEEIDYSVLAPDILAYSYKDAFRRFKDSTILVTDDGNTQLSDNPNVKKVSLDTVRDIDTASFVASYKDKENTKINSLSVGLSKYLLTYLPGDLFSFEGMYGNYRLVEKQDIPDNAKMPCEFYRDVYSQPAPFVAKKPSGLFPESALGVAEDLFVRLLEINRFTNKDRNGVVLLRVRQHHQIQGTLPFLSVNDVTYTEYGEQQYAVAGGVLTETIAASGQAIIEIGPKFNTYGPDISTVLDLSSEDDIPSWKSGMQVALIDDELFFLRGVTAVEDEDATFTLDGLIRARLGTNYAAHSIGATVYIFNLESLTILAPSYLSAGTTVYGKSVPFTSIETADISDIDAVTLAYKGGGYRPLPCVNLNTVDLTSGYVSGTDVSLKWNYRNVSGGAGVGLDVSDAVYYQPLPEGYFKLEFLTTGNTLVRTVTDLTDPAYVYSDANRISDFGSASFKVRVYNILNGLSSEYDEVTITAAGA